VLYFVTADFRAERVRAWLRFLDQESERRGERLNVYFVYVGNAKDDPAHLRLSLAQLGEQLALKNLALTFVPSATDRPSDMYRNQIDPATPATLIVYRQRRIIANWQDPDPTANRLAAFRNLLDQSDHPYFALPEVGH
jgi:protocatechuate 3,4-dioxygenase beta subunit